MQMQHPEAPRTRCEKISRHPIIMKLTFGLHKSHDFTFLRHHLTPKPKI